MSLADKFIKSTKLKGSGRLSKVLEEPVAYHDTGIPALNLAYSGDFNLGTRSGVTTIAGRSRSFKTLFGLISAKAYLDHYPDAHMIFYDSEGGASADYFKSVGIDPDRVIYIRIMNIEELKFDMFEKLDAIKKAYEETKQYERFVFFVDSIGNLASIKEVKDAEKGSDATDMGTRAKSLKSLFRIITPYFDMYQMHGIFINHVTADISGMGGRDQMTGGCLVEGTEVIMSDGSRLEIQNIQPGDYVMTQYGPKRVTHTWNPDTLDEGTPECFELTFEDGKSIVCSANHKFLVKNESGDYNWVKASDLTEDMELKTL